MPSSDLEGELPGGIGHARNSQAVLVPIWGFVWFVGSEEEGTCLQSTVVLPDTGLLGSPEFPQTFLANHTDSRQQGKEICFFGGGGHLSP